MLGGKGIAEYSWLNLRPYSNGLVTPVLMHMVNVCIEAEHNTLLTHDFGLYRICPLVAGHKHVLTMRSHHKHPHRSGTVHSMHGLAGLSLSSCTYSAYCQETCSRTPLYIVIALLVQAGVRTMCLPAAHETVHTWIQGFGLQPMLDEDLDAACKDLRLLIFPGTQVLQKQLLPPLPPKEGPLMTPPWADEAAAATALPAEGQEAAGLTSSDGVVAAAAAVMDEAAAAVKQDLFVGLSDPLSAVPAAAMPDTIVAVSKAEEAESPAAAQAPQPQMQVSVAVAAPFSRLPTGVSQASVMEPVAEAEGQKPDLHLGQGLVPTGPDAAAGALAHPSAAHAIPAEEQKPKQLSVEGQAGAADHQDMTDDDVEVDVTTLSPATMRRESQVHLHCMHWHRHLPKQTCFIGRWSFVSQSQLYVLLLHACFPCYG